MKHKKVLITGASGYQAGFIIRRMMDAFDLTLTDRVEPPAEFARLKFIKGDITDFNDVKMACEGQDAVVHLVALVRGRETMPHMAYADIMVKGTWNVAEACVQCGVKRLVNFSSVVACGWPKDPSVPYKPGKPSMFGGSDQFYAMAKYLGEEIGRIYHQARGLQVIHLRPAMIAGDGQNQDPKKPEGVSGLWFLHVHPSDVAQAVELAVSKRSLKYGTFHVAGDHPAGLFDISSTKKKLGFVPQHNWEEVR